MNPASETVPGAPPATAIDVRRFGIRLAVAFAVVSTVMGVLVFERIVDSERQLSAAWQQINADGRTLSVTGCVDAVLAWHQRCGALETLCENSASGMMMACLDAQDRTAYCAEMGNQVHDTRFGYEDCQARELDRDGRGVCAFSYRAVDLHCTRLSVEAGR